MKRIAVISDTHGLLRPEVIRIITGCDTIIHGGDINNQQILDQLSALAPLYVVRGNNDKEWAEHLPESITIQIEDCVLFVVHKKSLSLRNSMELMRSSSAIPTKMPNR